MTSVCSTRPSSSLTYDHGKRKPVISTSQSFHERSVRCQPPENTRNLFFSRRWWQGHPSTGEDPSPGAVHQVWEERQAEGQGQEQSKGNRVPTSCLVGLDTHFDHFCFISDTKYRSQYRTTRTPTSCSTTAPLPYWPYHWFRASQPKSRNSAGHIAPC
jgi:hypothetical protein